MRTTELSPSGDEYELLVSGHDVTAYLTTAGLLPRLADDPADVIVREVTAGNMNRVFIARGPLGSVAVKQAPPFVQVAGPEWPIDPARIGAEARAYELLAGLVPDAVPAIELVDLERFVMVMEDLSDLEVVRDVLVDEITTGGASTIDFDNLGAVVGRFVGELTLATSEGRLGSEAHAELVATAANPELCALTVDVVLDEPYREHEHNHWHPVLDDEVRALYTDEALAAAVLIVRDTFDTRAEALLHGDLHTGSVMVGTRDGVQAVKVFDPEFSFVGPIGMDLGLFWANLTIASVAARAVGRDQLADDRLRAIDASWDAFAAVWDAPGARDAAAVASTPLESIRSDAWRFAGVEAMRRVVGYSHAADLETLPAEVQAHAHRAVFDLARHWILTGEPAPTSTSTSTSAPATARPATARPATTSPATTSSDPTDPAPKEQS